VSTLNFFHLITNIITACEFNIPFSCPLPSPCPTEPPTPHFSDHLAAFHKFSFGNVTDGNSNPATFHFLELRITQDERNEMLPTSRNCYTVEVQTTEVTRQKKEVLTYTSKYYVIHRFTFCGYNRNIDFNYRAEILTEVAKFDRSR